MPMWFRMTGLLPGRMARYLIASREVRIISSFGLLRHSTSPDKQRFIVGKFKVEKTMFSYYSIYFVRFSGKHQFTTRHVLMSLVL